MNSEAMPVELARISKKTRKAYHEAGHAVMARYCEVPIEFATVCPTDEYSGIVRLGEDSLEVIDSDVLADPDSREGLESHVMMSMAGQAAECLLVKRKYRRPYWRVSPGCDLERIMRLLERLTYRSTCDPEWSKESSAYYELLWSRTLMIIERDWHYVEGVAEAFLRDQTLSGEQINEIIVATAQQRLKEQHEGDRVQRAEKPEAALATTNGQPLSN